MAKGNKYLEVIDAHITNLICTIFSPLSRNSNRRMYLKGLEYSCHGIVWLVATTASIWLLWSRELFEAQVNIISGIIFDIAIVGLLKVKFRRGRPPGNKRSMFEFGPDTYSFPSGHVSRSVMLVYMFVVRHGPSLVPLIASLTWCLSLAVSRILLRKHYFFDIIGGFVLGLMEGWLLTTYLWISDSSALSVVTWLTEMEYSSDGDFI